MYDKNMSARDRSRLVKTLLVQQFGAKHVRVTGGRGTAYGWVDANVEIVRPESCGCGGKARGIDACSACKIALEEARTKANAAVEGVPFGHYYGDMDSTPRREFLLQIGFAQ